MLDCSSSVLIGSPCARPPPPTLDLVGTPLAALGGGLLLRLHHHAHVRDVDHEDDDRSAGEPADDRDDEPNGEPTKRAKCA